jgi:formylmethanofuran dehydrogenase subunit D
VQRFILNAARSATRGTLINVGKESQEYIDLTNSMTMAASDMQAIGLPEGQMTIVRTEFGEARFKCEAGKPPCLRSGPRAWSPRSATAA